MLYMTSKDGQKLIVLESANLEKLKEGKPIVTQRECDHEQMDD